MIIRPEQELPRFGDDLIGVDEAGRGPLAGPLVVAAVQLNPTRPISGLDDSKKLSAKRRDDLYQKIIDRAADFAIVNISRETIDEINIYQATLQGMQQAVAAMSQCNLVAVDGNALPKLPCACVAVIKGDGRVPQIAAASILAKVARDRLMQKLDREFPLYGFARHKGYPTIAHRQAIAKHGPCEHHRRSFRLLPPKPNRRTENA